MKRRIAYCAAIQFLFCCSLFSQVSFHNLNKIDLPGLNPAPEPANPYPSSITVNGLSGIISGVRVTLHGFSHTFPDAADLMLSSPSGVNVVILSDIGGPIDVSNVDITLDDNAAASLPDATELISGTYKPTNSGASDSWPAGTPVANGTTLAAFNGFNPNGEWKLYASSDVDDTWGSVDGGWTLTLTTSNSAVLELEHDANGTRVVRNTTRGFENLSLQCYPNPASTFINIRPNKRLNEQVSFQLLDNAGNIVANYNNPQISNNGYRLNVSGIKGGTYLLATRTADKRLINKIVISTGT